MAAILHLDIQRPCSGADAGCRKPVCLALAGQAVEVSTD